MNTQEIKKAAKVQDLVVRERRMALSDREWKHRLRGYGYAITDTKEGRFVTSLVRGAAICSVPPHMAG